MLGRLEARDANNILQGGTDLVPGRPTSKQHHRALEIDPMASEMTSEAGHD